MSTTTVSAPRKRIEVIDALRGFALIGIFMLHCLEHFDAAKFAGEVTPLTEWLNAAANNVVTFLFLGKAYAIFSFLFGLSFFIQMDNQADKGLDFRLRFAWRLALLFVLGYIDGLFYAGEILMVYAVFGLVLIPLYKLPTKWLVGVGLILLFQIPTIIYLIVISGNPELASTPPEIRGVATALFKESRVVYTEGSFGDVMLQNSFNAQAAKWFYYLQSVNGLRILGLFVAGMLVGRLGIHKDEDKMVKYAGKAFLIGLPLFAVCYILQHTVSFFGIEGKWLLRSTGTLIGTYTNLGLMLMIMGLFVLSYFKLGTRNLFNRLAPVGRMSLTNYMMQSVIGSIVFYGWAFGLAPYCGHGVTWLISLPLCLFQIWFSTWWLKRYYYGPVEYLWRSLTWCSFAKTPFLRKTA